MADRRATNRAMFWRIIRRLFGANPGRLFVMLLALGAGAAVTAALLNLQVDAKRRLTTEFRSFGSNVVIAPRNHDQPGVDDHTLEESILRRIPSSNNENGVAKIAFLYFVAGVTPLNSVDSPSESERTIQAVVAGFEGAKLADILPSGNAKFLFSDTANDSRTCILGEQVAAKLQEKSSGVPLRPVIRYRNLSILCSTVQVQSFGGPEDSYVFVDMSTARRLTILDDRISLIQLSVPGTSGSIDRYISDLQKRIPEADVHGIRQFTEGEAKIFNRISGLLTATVGIVLVLTGLCVMAAMTNVAMERKMDVGLMKAIGGSVRRVLRLFLAEAALLGLAGGMIGAAAGIFLSIGLGKAVFGVAARPRLIVYPVAVVLTIIVAIISAYPLRRLASIRPASVFRGEA
jgi:ABC-type antimicrobial peptide transport system permease subunit